MAERSSILFTLNGQPHQVSGADIFLNLADYLRRELGLTGTKVVCSEGDCGACTVLLSRDNIDFISVNSCITPVFSLEGVALVTIEGISSKGVHPIQHLVAAQHGAQCGFCTPGIVTTLVGRVDRAKQLGTSSCLSEKQVKNSLTGNLCRCTGYQPIIKAASQLDCDKVDRLGQQFQTPAPHWDSIRVVAKVLAGECEVYIPRKLTDALSYRDQYPDSQIVAGGTDLEVLINKGKLKLKRILSLQNISDLKQVKVSASEIQIGCSVTWASLTEHLPNSMLELRNLIHIFASPQIKNVATVVGNLVNASPIADGLPFLFLVEANLVVESLRGQRQVSILELFQGYKKLALAKNEIVVGLKIPILSPDWQWKLYKVSARRDLDISAVTFAGAVKVDQGQILESRWALGGVGPVVLRLPTLEAELQGAKYEAEVFLRAGTRATTLINPIGDVRGSSEFRKQLVKNLFNRFYADLILKGGS